MSDTTKIQWATSTGNPWIGCTKVSPGCKNCYASTLDENRFSRTMGGGTKENPVSHWGKGAPRFRTKGFWKNALRWNKAAEGTRHHGGECPRIFPSLCDWLDEEVPIEWLADFLNLIADTPNLDWLLLTKRPELCFDRINAATRCANYKGDGRLWNLAGLVPHNVWVGTSVENQEWADKRIPELLKIPAAVRFLSVEPLLGPIDLSTYLKSHSFGLDGNDKSTATPDWVIVGGESGSDARACNVEWIRAIVQDCRRDLVPVFVKQLGANILAQGLEVWPNSPDFKDSGQKGYLSYRLNDSKGGDLLEWPKDLQVREYPSTRN